MWIKLVEKEKNMTNKLECKNRLVDVLICDCIFSYLLFKVIVVKDAISIEVGGFKKIGKHVSSPSARDAVNRF